MTPRGLAARRTCVVVAHDHMRQRVHASIFARFSMVCATSDRFKTGGAHNGASRRVDVVIDPYGVLRGACFAVGASIARPRNDPPNMERADANSYPVGFANLHRRVVLFSFSPRTANGRPYTRVCARPCWYARTDVCTYRTFLETPIRFFLRPSAILRSSEIHCKAPNKTRKP